MELEVAAVLGAHRVEQMETRVAAQAEAQAVVPESAVVVVAAAVVVAWAAVAAEMLVQMVQSL
jgi:hypothetical protein